MGHQKISDSEALAREAAEWLIRMTSGEARQDDLHAFRAWRSQSPLHASAFAKRAGLWRSLGASLAAVEGAEAVRPPHRLERSRIGRRGFLCGGLAVSAAAVAVAVVRPPLGLWLSVTDVTADYRTATGEQRQLAVADGVSVEMNTGTALNLPVADGGRVDLLSGEAVVSVSRNRSVTVTASNGTVMTSDAVFNVRCLDDGARVTCIDGAVDVTHRGRTVRVGSRQEARYDGHGMTIAAVSDPGTVATWRQGTLIFRDQPVSEVVAEVNRYRRGRIVVINSSLASRRVTARLRLDKLDDLVVQLHDAFGTEAHMLPGEIVLLT